MLKRGIFLILITSCSLISNKNDTSNPYLDCLNEIDFDNPNPKLWNQTCENYGMLSGMNALLCSTDIKCLFEIERKISKTMINGDCYFIYDKSRNSYLQDIKLKGKSFKFDRSTRYSTELKEILFLYKKWIKIHGADINKKGNTLESPLTNTQYFWKKI